MASGRRSFNQILNSLEGAHSRALMDRARTVNRIAKQVRGRNRSKAYAVKHGALTALIAKLPSRIELRTDNRLADFVVVGLASGRAGLHMPADLI
jgi:hypothetical protein